MEAVGYLEGTDPVLLTKLAAQGIDTVPLSNGADNHGKYIVHLTAEDNISLVIGYLHKFMPSRERNISADDLLFSCMIHNIPVMVIAPTEDHERASAQLGPIAQHVILVDPADLPEKVFSSVE